MYFRLNRQAGLRTRSRSRAGTGSYQARHHFVSALFRRVDEHAHSVVAFVICEEWTLFLDSIVGLYWCGGQGLDFSS